LQAWVCSATLFSILLTGAAMTDFHQTFERLIERAIARRLSRPGDPHAPEWTKHWRDYRNSEDRRIKARLLRLEGHVQWVFNPPGILFKDRVSISPASPLDTQSGHYCVVYCEDRNEASRALIASVHPEIFGDVIRPAAFCDGEGDYYCWIEPSTVTSFGNFGFRGQMSQLFRGTLTEEQFLASASSPTPFGRANNPISCDLRQAVDLYRAYQMLLKDTGWVMPAFSDGWLRRQEGSAEHIYLNYRRALSERLDRISRVVDRFLKPLPAPTEERITAYD
jgi:hypothetical protein